MAELHRCDYCKTTVEPASMVMWLQISKIGIDADGMGDPFLEGEFCSINCTIEHLSSVRHLMSN